jgi:GNAT superfamily N-acetyltransferase
MDWQKDRFTLSDDPTRLDLNAVVGLLQATYWAARRTRETIQKSLRHSLNFGLHDGARQIGFARVVTDYTTHSYLCDVVVAPEYRGHGLGTWIVECILDHPELQTTRMDVVTKDAQAFYAEFGFRPHPQHFLVRYPPHYAGGSDWPKPA